MRKQSEWGEGSGGGNERIARVGRGENERIVGVGRGRK